MRTARTPDAAGTVFLDGGPEEAGFRPSASVLFRSLARECAGVERGTAAAVLELDELGPAPVRLVKGPRGG